MPLVHLYNGNWVDDSTLPGIFNPATGKIETYDPTLPQYSGVTSDNLQYGAPNQPGYTGWDYEITHDSGAKEVVLNAFVPPETFIPRASAANGVVNVTVAPSSLTHDAVRNAVPGGPLPTTPAAAATMQPPDGNKLVIWGAVALGLLLLWRK